MYNIKYFSALFKNKFYTKFFQQNLLIQLVYTKLVSSFRIGSMNQAMGTSSTFIACSPHADSHCVCELHDLFYIKSLIHNSSRISVFTRYSISCSAGQFIPSRFCMLFLLHLILKFCAIFLKTSLSLYVDRTRGGA